MNPGPSKHQRPPLPEGPYLVVGLARSGSAIARVLAERGERVFGCDSGRPAEAEGLGGAGVEISLEVDGTALLDQVKTVVKSPGVAREAPVVAEALRREMEVAGELELAWRLLPNRFCAVTGTNGKTTTTELIGHIHRTAGLPVEVAGNVGTPLASLIGRAAPEALVACEASSFQLEDTSGFAPECAVFLNLSPDHLDRHGTVEAYLAAKLRVFANQGPDDVAVVNRGASALRETELPGRGTEVGFCPEGERDEPQEGCDVELENGRIRWRGQDLVEVDELELLGAHNVENAMAAAGACLALGVEGDAVAAGLRGFTGVPHRLERIAEVGGVLYVNDSKATNVASALAAIGSFEGGLHLILGGSLKGETFERMAEPVSERCLACYLIGEAAGRLADDLVPAARAGVVLQECGTLELAFGSASERARPGEVVLLAPACASFDAYEDFEQRGEHFRRLVEELR